MNAMVKFRDSPFGLLRLAESQPVQDEPVVVEPVVAADPWAELAAIDIERALATNPRLQGTRSGGGALPFEALRSKLSALVEAKGWRSLAITSANKGVGKTTLLANLALSFARSGSKRVLVVELNQKNPGLAAMFAMNPKHDIEPVLQGELPASGQLWRLRDSVALACSQVKHQGVLSRWEPHALRTAIRRLEDELSPDLVIFDLPHLYSDDSTFAFLAECDGALAVARQDHCRLSDLDRCERHIAEQTQFAGFVVNRAGIPA